MRSSRGASTTSGYTGSGRTSGCEFPKTCRCTRYSGARYPAEGLGRPAGFDGFLLGEAVKEGARIQYGEVQAIAYGASGMPSLTVRTPSGETVSLDASFVSIATGINAHCGFDYRDDGLIASVKRLNPAFVPGKSRKAFIFELDVGEDYLERNLQPGDLLHRVRLETPRP